MNCRQARSAFEELINGDKSLPQLPQLEEHLAHCSECQAWLQREQQIVAGLEHLQGEAPPPDFSQGVLECLPDVPLQTLDQVVKVLERAWQEPGFREKLRTRPRSTLEGQGVKLPATMNVEVVSPEQAMLPTRRRLALPLPAPAEGPRSVEDLRARLRHTPAAVLLEPERAGEVVWAEKPPRPARQRSLLGGLRQVWTSLVVGLARPTPRRLLAPALAVAATLLLLFGLLYILQGEGPASTPGAATGAWSWLIGGVVLVSVVVFAVLVLGRRKR
jgi:uncharacterized protein YhhL (DUF1145 family)